MNAIHDHGVRRGRKFDQVLEGARKIFMRDGFERASVDDIAREAGVTLGRTLIADSLSATGETATYIGKIRHNVSAIVEALKQIRASSNCTRAVRMNCPFCQQLITCA